MDHQIPLTIEQLLTHHRQPVYLVTPDGRALWDIFDVEDDGTWFFVMYHEYEGHTGHQELVQQVKDGTTKVYGRMVRTDQLKELTQ